MEHLGAFPYWQLRFDAQGDPDPALRDRLLAELPGSGVTDLFVFSHGWNNHPATAKRLYERFFGLVESLLPSSARRRVGVAGVVWPAMAWLDEPIPDFAEGGAAGLGEAPASDRQLVEALTAVFERPEQQAQLAELADLLEARPDDPASLQRFHELLRALVDSDPVQPVTEEDGGEAGMLAEEATAVYGRFLAAEEQLAAGGPGALDDSPAARLGGTGGLAADDGGGAAGLLDQGRRLWAGAKAALRQATYFTMKRRAGAVGERGLGPLLGRLAEADPALRLHLVGHSFGARLVSFALAGVPQDRDPSPVKSLLLLQAAFSHFAFASSLPHDASRSGALAGLAARVDGPLVCCFSAHDSAVGVFYPVASFGARQDAAGAAALAYRWGALGHDGAQAVDAATVQVQPVHGRYAYAPGRFVNVDAADVVRSGGPPSGAHSDIFHPELAWIAVTAAGLAGVPARTP